MDYAKKNNLRKGDEKGCKVLERPAD